MTPLKDNLLAYIKSGQLDMKPQWHFVVRSVSYMSGLLLMGLLGLYLLSLVLFVLRESGLWWTPGFGLRGILFFVTTSPWLLIAVTLLFLGTLYILIRHFGHNYRHHAVYSLIGLVLFAILGTSLMHYFAIHEGMRDWSTNHRIPGLAPLYQQDADDGPYDITPGRVTSMIPAGFIIDNRTGTYQVHINPDTTLPPRGLPVVGDRVLVFGSHTGSSTIDALGVRPLPPPMDKRLKRLEHE